MSIIKHYVPISPEVLQALSLRWSVAELTPFQVATILEAIAAGKLEVVASKAYLKD